MTHRSHLLVLLAVAACDENAPPAAKPDPWAGTTPPASPASDPWSSGAPATPAAPPATPEPPPARGASALPQGDWTCEFLGSTWMNGTRFMQAIAMNGFTLRGSTYTSSVEGKGTVELDDLYVTFRGGGFDNWRGALNARDDGSLYLVFGGESHRDAEPGRGARINDIQCKPAH